MSINGRINVDALFHDRSGDTRLKVLSLHSGTPYTAGKVVYVTGTAGTSIAYISFSGYRNAAGDIVELNTPTRLAFAWSGSSPRALTDTGDEQFRVISSNNQVAVTQLGITEPVPALDGGAGTGTYTIIMWGPD
jgi:hypothetical protein